MHIVRKAPEGPAWKPVLGGQVLFAPITRAMLRRARRAGLKALDRPEDSGDETAPVADQIEELGDAFSEALILEGILDWSDFCLMDDEDDAGAGVPLPCSPEAKAIVLSDPVTFEAFDAAYVMPFVSLERERAAPGKGSPLSLNGTGQAETVAQDIATSPARPARARGAKSARTGSTSRKLTRKKTSGAF